MQRKPRAEVTRYAYHMDCSLKKTVHDKNDYCDGCPYPRHGFFCPDDMGCLRKDMERISDHARKRKENVP